MPVQPGWTRKVNDDFATAAPFGMNPNGWYGPYSYGTGDTAERRGNGKGIWLNSQSVMVGPGASGDGLQVPASVLDIWQHVRSDGVPVSGVLLPDQAGYHKDLGATQEWISFAFRVLDPAHGFKIVPLTWNDSETGNEEVDFPEIEFTPGTTTLALHFPNGQQVVPYIGYFNGKLGWSLNTGSYGFDITKWHLMSVRRTNGRLDCWIDSNPASAAPLMTFKDGDTGTQWGGAYTVTIPRTPMHWVLQTETSTLANTQPAAGAANHVQFDWVTIDTI
jgi:hypothetical protein